MDLTEPDLLITPFSLLTSLDTSPKKSLQLHQFLKTPLPSNHLKSPTSARNYTFKRKLSDVGEPNFSTNEGSNRVLEKSDSSKNQNIFPATQRPSSRFSSTSTVHSKHDRHRKFPQTSIPRKSGFSVTNSDQGKKRSTLAEKIGKSLFRAQSVAVFGKLRAQLSRNSGSNKDHSIPELKISVPKNHQNDSFSLKAATGEGGSKEKTSDDSDISSPLYPSFIRNNGKNDTNIPKSSLRKRRLEKQSALLDKDKDGPVSLSNMFRRKSCHCSDCGGLSEYEKRHLNVVSPSKRAEFNKQQKPSLRNRIETALPHLEKGLTAPDIQVSMQLEALDEEASAEGKLSSKIMSTNFRKKSSSSPDKYLSLAKQLTFQRNTPRLEQQSKLNHSGSISPLISNSPTAGIIALNEKSQLSKGSENGGDETLTLKLTLESPKRESEALKGLNLKYSFDAESPITLRRDTNENRNSRVSRGSSIIDRQSNQAVPEEKRFTKNLVLKPARNRPQKILVYEQSPHSKRDSIIIKTALQLPNLEKSPVLVKRSLSTRNRPNSETTIKGIYGLNNRVSSEDKSPTSRNTSSCRNLKNDTQISSIDSPIKIDALILPGLPKKSHPSRQKNLSLQTKSSSKRPQLPFESQKSARSIRGPDPIDLSKGIKTDRDSSSPINKSGKVLEALKFKEMSTDASDASPRKIKGVSLGKMQIGHLMKIYKKKEKGA